MCLDPAASALPRPGPRAAPTHRLALRLPTAVPRAPAPRASLRCPPAADQFRGQAWLPRFAAPWRYELRLCPDLITCSFTSAASVLIDVSAPTRFLVLNTVDLAIGRASICFQGKQDGNSGLISEISSSPCSSHILSKMYDAAT
ncbi:hypothetical protein E2562_019054 [Oryza meyeriana var. granulata]|uniref:Uncharacterized protein n=1 Tax=Oryza meyeriana var. granulata TaxID=110450 RepID=A0A6G1EMY4_9ORYZ|nr:hypothetical protein E2562_019054 [Oryza meyeriana var. granulata]